MRGSSCTDRCTSGDASDAVGALGRACHALLTQDSDGNLDIAVRLLEGALAFARRVVAEKLPQGKHVLAVDLIQQANDFRRLGLAVVDEQHRFGVNQRATLRRKGESPDVLVMTATPIPRTLAMTVYGDLDVSVLDELPAHRLDHEVVARRRELAGGRPVRPVDLHLATEDLRPRGVVPDDADDVDLLNRRSTKNSVCAGAPAT